VSRAPLLLAWLVLLLSACAAESPRPTPAPLTATATPGPAQTPAPPAVTSRPECLAAGPFPPLLPGLHYGANVFLLAGDAERTLALTTTAQFGWVRQQIHWRDIEGERGRFVWAPLDAAVERARASGLRILLSVVRSPPWADERGGLPDDPAAFAGFMRTLAQRYAGQVAAYQVWNEPNLAVENGGAPGTPAEYLATLRAAYPAVKAADPCALVVSAALAATATGDRAAAAPDLPFLEELYRLDGGAFLRSADIVAAHPGGGPYDPDAEWIAHQPDSSARYFRHVERVRALMLSHGDTRQVWITEVGWTVDSAAGAPPPVSEEQQAEYLLRALYRTRNYYPWVTAVFVWNLNFSVIGAPGDEKATFGILRPDWSPRPAYLTLQTYLNDELAEGGRDQPRFSGWPGHRAGWFARIHGKSRAAPVIAPNGSVYVASDVGRLYAFGPSGGLRWVYEASADLRSAPALGPDGALYLLDAGGTLTALDGRGAPLWARPLGASGRGTPQLLGERLYVAVDEAVVAVTRGGQVAWRAELGAETTPVAVETDRSVSRVYVATSGGTVLALDEGGREAWRASLPNPFAAPPAVGPGALVVADAEGVVYSLRTEDGAVAWTAPVVRRIVTETLAAGVPVVSAAPLLAADGTIYIAGRDGSLSALGSSGSIRWRYESGSDISATPIILADGTIAAGLMSNRAIGLSPAGELRWQARLRGAVRSSPALGPDGTLHVTTLGGRIYALPPR
jgi:polysaccharide biosynthesis protein PslG